MMVHMVLHFNKKCDHESRNNANKGENRRSFRHQFIHH